MQVEVYDERELDHATLTPECDAEALALIKELGLNNQRNESGARIAYPIPTAEQGFAIENIFAAATKLSDYNAGCIPLRVLKEIKKYQSENPGHTLIVRHCPPAQIKDPVLVAFCASGKDAWGALQTQPDWSKFQLIARWGDALESWATLIARATEIATARHLEALTEMASKIDRERKRIVAGGTVTDRRAPYMSGVINETF